MIWSNPQLMKQDSDIVTNIKMGPLYPQASTAANSIKLLTVFPAITNVNRLTRFEMLNLDFLLIHCQIIKAKVRVPEKN